MKLSEMDILLSHVDGIVITGNSRCCTTYQKLLESSEMTRLKKLTKNKYMCISRIEADDSI